MSRVVRILLLFLLIYLPTQSASAQGPTQRDWVENLVNGMGWDFGLPDEPEDNDYLTILDRANFLRVEAENAVQDEDLVSFKTYTSFGPFSGESWVNGITRPTQAHLKFLLPNDGRYQLSASLRLPGHQFEVAGKVLTGNGGNNFTRVVLGDVDLVAGEQEVIVTLPPNGSIDYLELKAPAHAPIAPLAGWELDQPLTMQNLAVTTLQLLEQQAALPPVGKPLLIEAESATRLGSAIVTDVMHIGSPSGNAWVRARTEETEIELTFVPPSSGVYRLELRATGTSPIITELDQRYVQSWDFPPYLESREWISLYLEASPHVLKVTLPPRAGFDSLTLRPLASSGEDFLNLSGLRSLGETPTFSTIDQITSLLAPLAPH